MRRKTMKEIIQSLFIFPSFSSNLYSFSLLFQLWKFNATMYSHWHSHHNWWNLSCFFLLSFFQFHCSHLREKTMMRTDCFSFHFIGRYRTNTKMKWIKLCIWFWSEREVEERKALCITLSLSTFFLIILC